LPGHIDRTYRRLTSIRNYSHFTVKISETDLYILADGHHRHAAAREMGVEVVFEIVQHPEGLTGDALLTAMWDGHNWYNIETGKSIW